MDIAWKSICESISLSGPHGLNWDQFRAELLTKMNLTEAQLNWPPGPVLTHLLSFYSKLSPNYRIGVLKTTETTKKDAKTRLMFFVDLVPVSMTDFLKTTDPNVMHFYCSSPILRHSHLFQGRPLQLSDSSLQTLETIASFGRNGVTQAELARVLGCDSKNAFHWLKSLIANDLIARTPVASKKSFTYLLTLTRHLDDEISSQNNSSHAETHTVVSSKEIRQKIVDILACAPDQTMVSKDVFAATGLDSLLIKNFRRAATKLNEIGWLEYLFEGQLIGPCCRLFRLKRKPAEGLDLKAFSAAQEEAKRLEHQEITTQLDTPRGLDFNPSQPIIHQIILLLARSFPEPLTTADISHRLNISRKYLYKLIERILPASGKAGVIGAEGVGKVSDFVGKEKRLKLFIKTEEFRDFYLQLFASDSINESSVVPSRPTTPFSSSIPASSPAQSPQSTTSSAASDTRTRQLRHQTLLQELADRKVLEVGKDLCQRLQLLLKDTRFTLDVKTLRRSVEILEREGQLKVVIATVPSGTRTLLVSPELEASDPFVQDYIAKMSEFVRSGPLSASTVKLQKLKESMLNPDFFVEGSLPLGKVCTPSANVKALLDFGFIHGVMARAQLLHQFLLETTKGQAGFETIPSIFEGLPLGLYLKLIGFVRMSRDLHADLAKYESTSVASLPELYREELSLNRKRFQAQIMTLLQILEQLQLIQGETQYSSLNFKLPFKYIFALQVPLLNYRGQVRKMIDFSHNGAFNEFWKGMQEICVEFSNHSIASIHEEETTVLALPKPILLARHADAWKHRPSRERDLERVIRKLALDHLDRSSIDLADLQTYAEEYEVSLERTQAMYNNFIAILEARRLEKLAAKRLRKDDDEDSQDSDSDSGDENVRWTPSDWTKLSLAFCILQQPLFTNSPSNTTIIPNSGIKWHLASKIFDKPKSSTVIRRHGLKLFKNYEELKRILEIDTIVRLVVRKYAVDQVTVELFLEIYEACQAEITAEESSVFDEFTILESSTYEVFGSRQENYMETIDSWAQSRFFRHELILNNPGRLVTNLHEDPTATTIAIDSTTMLIRKILVYSLMEAFDYDSTVSLLKQVDPDSLNAGINNLLASNFACKNRFKDKIRLFGFPLVVSDSVRSVLEHSDDLFATENTELSVSNSTETLTIGKIDQIFPSVQVIVLPCDTSSKFDAPIKLKMPVKQQFNVSTLSNTNSMWYSPSNDLLEPIAKSCLGHVFKSIKTRPGICISDLKRKYDGVFVSFEMDDLIAGLIENNCIELISSQYLQCK